MDMILTKTGLIQTYGHKVHKRESQITTYGHKVRK